MKMCNAVITVFNAKHDLEKDCDVYHGTVLEGVSWYEQTVSNVTTDGLKAANRVIVRIPNSVLIDKYVSPLFYAKADDVTGLCTLQTGDVIVKGALYASGMTPAQLHSEYKDVMTVLGVTDNTNAPHGKHWKVTGA